MVDVKTFLASLKFSWIRRLSSSDAFWVKILNKELSDLHCDPNNILFQGPSELQSISKKIKNSFWKDVLNGVGSMITATSYCLPNKFLLLPIFRNPLFKIGNKAIPLNILQGNINNVRQVADFFKEGQVELYNWDAKRKRF